jgi:outer membrane protein OmpA-like peptidoglycan-associated protein
VDRSADAKLVRQRAESVRAALVAAGIAANRVQVTEVAGRGNGVEVVLTD